MIDIDEDCAAISNDGACNDFVSDKSLYGQQFNTTQFLNEGEQCQITIDARGGVARVIFDDTSDLGVLYNGYVIGEAITIPEGEV